jgi:hypothetical protein
LSNPEVYALLNQLFTGLVFVLLIDAAWIAYAAKRQSQRAWVLVNIFGILILMFALVLTVVLRAFLSGATSLATITT